MQVCEYSIEASMLKAIHFPGMLTYKLPRTPQAVTSYSIT
jgi:hypothetical protein